jgi:hypothetical protein
MKCTFGLNSRVMKHELSSSSKLISLAHFYHASAKGVPMGTAALTENISEDI